MPDLVHSVTQETIRVLIVDDHALVRSGLRFFLLAFDDLELVGEATTAEETLRLCDQVRPDVVLLDSLVPGMDVASLIHTLGERYPETKIIALTSFRAEELARGVLEAGAVGYLLKNVQAEDLADAIRAASAGEPVLPPGTTQPLTQTTPGPQSPDHDLTPLLQYSTDGNLGRDCE
jgi:NarL family two-component system response regulator LiaR